MDVIGSIPVGPTTKNPVATGRMAGSGGVFALPWNGLASGGFIVGPLQYLAGMEHVIVRTGPEGLPTAVLSRGREWAVGAEPVRWYERVNWWEVNRRMPKGLGRVDVEVLQVAQHYAAGARRPGRRLAPAGGGGRCSLDADPRARSPRAVESPPPRLLGDAAGEGLR